MMPRVKGDRIELVCNECGIMEGSIDGAILRAVVTSGIQHAAPMSAAARKRIGDAPTETVGSV